MILTVTLRLNLSPDSTRSLLSEVRRFNEAAQWLSGIAFTEKLFSWLSLQRRAYRVLRERFCLMAAQAVVCVRKVASAYSNSATGEAGKVPTMGVDAPLQASLQARRDNCVLRNASSVPVPARGYPLLGKGSHTRLERQQGLNLSGDRGRGEVPDTTSRILGS